MDPWPDSRPAQPRGAAAQGAAKTPELSPYLRDLDLTTRALYAGVTLEELPNTTLLDIDLRYRAKELETYAQARAMVELKLADMSAWQLGKDDEKDEEDSESKIAAWEVRGEEIKQTIREKLYYALGPEHVRAMMDLADHSEIQPLEGVSPTVARTVSALLAANTFTHGEWVESELRAQLSAGDARKRLEAAAEYGPDR